MATAHHILVVDDDPIFLAVAESVVLSLGDHTVTTACDGVEGLAALRAARHPIAVIVRPAAWERCSACASAAP